MRSVQKQTGGKGGSLPRMQEKMSGRFAGNAGKDKLESQREGREQKAEKPEGRKRTESGKTSGKEGNRKRENRREGREQKAGKPEGTQGEVRWKMGHRLVKDR